METKGRKMAKRDYGLQARLSQHLKDVRLILAESERTGTKTPLSQIHKTLLEQAEELGFGDADNSAVVEAFRHPRMEER
jgi:3-hydroxyisobutyrate dehydrogenase-like beta-hydroxyacid dehydrogenase